MWRAVRHSESQRCGYRDASIAARTIPPVMPRLRTRFKRSTSSQPCCGDFESGEPNCDLSPRAAKPRRERGNNLGTRRPNRRQHGVVGPTREQGLIRNELRLDLSRFRDLVIQPFDQSVQKVDFLRGETERARILGGVTSSIAKPDQPAERAVIDGFRHIAKCTCGPAPDEHGRPPAEDARVHSPQKFFRNSARAWATSRSQCATAE